MTMKAMWLLLLFLFHYGKGFAPKSYPLLGFSITHKQMATTALCRAQYHWLKRNGVNGKTPTLPNPDAMFPISKCPVDSWCEEVYGYKKSEPIHVLNTVRESCADVDFGVTKNNPLYHFDDEFLPQTNRRLIISYQTIVDQIKKGTLESARKELGQFMHTLQDFYAHSNWVESGRRVNVNIGRENSFGMPLAVPSTATCKDTCEATEETCYNAIKRAEGATYRCPISNVITDSLTSGYYTEGLEEKPHGKCSHGGCYDAYSRQTPTGGINKDTLNYKFSPHHMLHNVAADIAVSATELLLSNLQVAVGDENFGNLIGFDSPGFAILMDTTGSMSDSIDAAINWATELVRKKDNNGVKFFLMPFNDPGWGPLLSTTDVELMISWLDDLHASGGGDIPEQCFPALLQTLQSIPRGSSTVVFTDAPSHHQELYPQIQAAAKNKAINFVIQYLGSAESDVAAFKNTKNDGTTSFIQIAPGTYDDQTLSLYQNLSACTGGIFLSGGSSVADIANTTSIIEVSPKNFKAYVLRQDVVTEGKNWTFPISNFVVTLEIIISKSPYFELSAFHLMSPVGTNVLNTSVVVNTQGTVFLRIHAPKIGIWTFGTATRVAIRDAFSFIVQSTNTELFISEFLVQTNDARYPTTVQVEGNPVVGSNYLTEVTGIGSTESILHAVELIFCDNGTVGLTAVPVKENVNTWLFNITVPSFPFCIQVKGEDSKGNQFLQLQQHQITPTSIQLQANLTGNFSSSLFPGDDLDIQFSVINLGLPQTFSLLATETGHLLDGPVQPSTVQLEQNTSANGNVHLHASTNALPGSSSIIQVSATSASSYFQNNFLTLSITVGDPDPDLSPPNCTIHTNISHCPLLSSDGIPPGSCSNTMWGANFSYFDLESGILKVVFSNETSILWSPTPLFNTSFPNTTFYTTASASCCVSEASLAAVDNSGLVQRCQIAIQRVPPAPTGKVPVAIIVGVVLAVLVTVAILVALVVFIKRRNNENKVGISRSANKTLESGL